VTWDGGWVGAHLAADDGIEAGAVFRVHHLGLDDVDQGDARQAPHSVARQVRMRPSGGRRDLLLSLPHSRLTGVMGRRAGDGAGGADAVWSRKALFMGLPRVHSLGQKAVQ
jgi:hypothetical protein